MQTLTIGSFLNLDNREKVEALKFTAALVAEKAANAVTEQMTETAVANLANNFWDKAEYVTREPERRQLQQIFVDEFIARFAEIKPFAAAEQSVIEAASGKSVERNDAEPIAGQTVADSNGENQIAATTTRDEFLGFVQTHYEQPNEIAENSSLKSQAENESIQSPSDANQPETPTTQAETQEPNIQTVSASGETPETSDQNQSAVSASATVKAGETTESKTSEASKNNVGAAVKTPVANAQQAATEPFEFEKCSITLNLNLLPADSGNSRRVIVSTASHNLPPEVELLEIAEGNDLTGIAELVREKLLRFQQTLPAKYINQLRQSKTKAAARKSPASKTAMPSVTTEKPNIQPPALQTSGEQKAAEAKSNGELATIANAATARAAAPVTASKQPAVNTVQPSLF